MICSRSFGFFIFCAVLFVHAWLWTLHHHPDAQTQQHNYWQDDWLIDWFIDWLIDSLVEPDMQIHSDMKAITDRTNVSRSITFPNARHSSMSWRTQPGHPSGRTSADQWRCPMLATPRWAGELSLAIPQGERQPINDVAQRSPLLRLLWTLSVFFPPTRHLLHTTDRTALNVCVLLRITRNRCRRIPHMWPCLLEFTCNYKIIIKEITKFKADLNAMSSKIPKIFGDLTLDLTPRKALGLGPLPRGLVNSNEYHLSF